MARSKKLEKWAKKKIKEYRTALLLDVHEVYFKYVEDPELSTDTIMEINVRYPYKCATIVYGDIAIREFKKEGHGELEHTIVHELCHIITEEMYLVGGRRFVHGSQLEDARERCTDHIANVVFRNISGRNL